MSPLIFEYQRWDDHLIQWLDGQYETIELLKKDGASGPVVWVFLTERASFRGSKRQLHFVNDTELARTLNLSAGDREVHFTNIEVAQLPTPELPRFRLSFDTPIGRIVWDFQARGAPSAQHGGRLVDALDAAHDLKGGLLALYLANSAVSTKDTKVAIGDGNFSAAPWAEISKPPYFVAYRGVHSAPAHIAYFPAIPGVRVSVHEAPSEYRDGAEWLYRWQAPSESSTVSRDLRVQVRFASADSWRFSAPNFEHAVAVHRGMLETQELASSDRGERASVRFNPALPDLLRTSDGRHTSRFALSMAGVETLLTGAFSFSKSKQRVTGELRPDAPAWATKLALRVSLDLGPDGHTYSAATSYPDAGGSATSSE